MIQRETRMDRNTTNGLRIGRRSLSIFIVFILLAILSCSLPLNLPQAETDNPNVENQVYLTMDHPATGNQVSGVTHTGFTVPPDLALPPVDVNFEIDCSRIDPLYQADCDTYLENTRSVLYPFVRLLTGSELSDCYDTVYYAIVPDEELITRQGEASENHITYNLRSTLNLNVAPLYDSHEILHVIAFCNGALDQHVFHAAFESHMDLTLAGILFSYSDRDHIASWLETRLVPDLMQSGAGMETATPGPNQGNLGSELFDACAEIFGSLVTILYYDSGIETIKQIYRDTIHPGPEIVPNSRLAEIFGDSLGRQFQVVVEGVRQNPIYQFDVPVCGIE